MWVIRAEVVWQSNGSKGRLKIPEFYLGEGVMSREDALEIAGLVINPWGLVASDYMHITAEKVIRDGD